MRSKKLLVESALYGTEGMTDAELFALVVCSTERRYEVLSGVLCEPGASLQSAYQSKKLTRDEAARALAVVELRARLSRPAWRGTTVSNGLEVYNLMKSELPGLQREKVWTLLVDARHRLIAAPICISTGSLMASVIHPREVFRPAIAAAAAALILVHNHPSGDPTPSVEDHQVTVRIAEAGVVVGIRVLDHVVIAADGYRSFKEEGWLQ